MLENRRNLTLSEMEAEAYQRGDVDRAELLALADESDGVDDAIEQAETDGYERGVEQGRQEMRDALLQEFQAQLDLIDGATTKKGRTVAMEAATTAMEGVKCG